MARLVSLLVASVAVTAAAAGFVHPGVLVSGQRIADIKAAIADGVSPAPAALANARASPYANTSWALQGPPANLSITCGSYSRPDWGCTAESDDGAAAYLQALLYQLTGEAPYAAKAIEIMDAYSSVREYTLSNAPLQAAWGASKWARAAELIIHSPAGWPAASQAAFIAFLTNVSLPLIKDGSKANGNWELSMMEGAMGIAVLTEDAALLQHAVGIYRQRIPAYYYLSKIDGDRPVEPPGYPNTNWNGQTVFNASVDGVCQETCRDFGHTQMGTAAALNAAETAFIQGVDLYAEVAPRLTAALEFHANFLLGAPPPAYLCNGSALKLSLQPTFEVGYRHYATVSRAAPLPLTWRHVLTQVRPMRDEANVLMMIHETLSHGAPGPAVAHGAPAPPLLPAEQRPRW